MKKCFLLLLVFFLFGSLNAAPKHSKNTKYPSYKGLVMAGYQGWFHQPRKGVMYPDENSVRIDMWPDVSEYEKTYPTGQKLADGSTARFFCSTDESTVDLHFKWMKEYGVDGVFVQRFFSYTRGDQQSSVPNRILANALEAASKYDRAIAVMYDLSGLKKSGEDCSLIMEDWKKLVDNQKVTNQAGKKTYLHHNGKPVIAIWGVGFPDRPYNIRNIGLDRLIDFLQNDPVYGGCTVMLGVPTFWRNLEADCINDPYLHTVIKKADIVLPWTVQRFSPLLHNDMDRFRDLVIEDIRWCKENGVDYVPAVTPGFSWHNLSKLEFPDDVVTRDTTTQYQFMSGEWMMVAPVYTRKNVRDSIYFPAGEWYDYWTGKTYEGGKWLDKYEAKLDICPVFIRQGAIIPMYPDMNYVGEKPADVLTLDLYPYGNTSFNLYEDDGLTRDYKKGEFACTLISVSSPKGEKGTITVDIAKAKGDYKGRYQERTYLLDVRSESSPSNVTVAGKPLSAISSEVFNAGQEGWYFDASDRMGRVKVRTNRLSTNQDQKIVIGF